MTYVYICIYMRYVKTRYKLCKVCNQTVRETLLLSAFCTLINIIPNQPIRAELGEMTPSMVIE